jgi:ATP-dependent DNA helicase RecQ
VTASATPATRDDIARVIGLVRPVTVLQSFDRPNLSFGVFHYKTERERIQAATQTLRRSGNAGTSIVYVPTRDRTDGMSSLLRRWGFAAAPYHAGLPGKARRALLGRFLDGRIRVMVATNAFGMGIDKPDVRLVLHLGIPARPEAYYQEAGRAGRDGEPGRCEMHWIDGDLSLAERMAAGGPGRSKAYRVATLAGIRAMRRYVATRGCRRRVLLEYLGESEVRCSGCDRCGMARSLLR